MYLPYLFLCGFLISFFVRFSYLFLCGFLIYWQYVRECVIIYSEYEQNLSGRPQAASLCYPYRGIIMKKQFITAVILASMLITACGAVPADNAVTSADTEAAVTETTAGTAMAEEEPEPAQASSSDSEKAAAKTSLKEESKEEEKSETEEEAEEAETEDEAEEAEADDEAEEAGTEDEETDEIEEADSEDEEADSEDEVEETDSEDEEAESDEEENGNFVNAYKATTGRSAAKSSRKAETEDEAADSEDEDAESEEEAEDEDEDTESEDEEIESDEDEDYISFWDIFPDASDGDYDNFWDMIEDGDYDEFEDMFPDEDDKAKAPGRESGHSRERSSEKETERPGIRPFAGRNSDEEETAEEEAEEETWDEEDAARDKARSRSDERSHENPGKRSGKKEEEKAVEETEEESEEEAEEESEEEEEYEEEFAPSEGLTFRSNRDGTAAITGMGSCTDTVLVIPGTSPKGDVVTAIADEAFYHAEGIETVVFENLDIEIGSKAFAESSIENLLIYDSIITIDEDAFLYCEKLSYFAVSESEVVTCAYSFDSAFESADLVFAGSVLLLNDESFVYSDVRSILAEDCSIMIGEDAFDYCENIETIEFVDCLTDIGPYAFFCTGSSMEVLFEDCDVLIEQDAFAFSDITDLEINGSTVQIGEDAFDYCESVESIIVRSSVVDTDPYAFYGCGDKAKVVFENGEIKLGKDAFAFADITSLKIIRCETDIGQEAFKSCVDLERVDICSGNINIGRRAFYHCTGLKEISLSDSGSGPHTIVIGDDAFEFCGLEKVMLGKGSIGIGSGAFEYCEDLTDVKIRGDLESVGRNAFFRCSDDLAIHYGGEVYDAKTIQDAVQKDDESSPQPSQRSMPQVERRSTPQPDQDRTEQSQGRLQEQPGRRSDSPAQPGSDRSSDAGSDILTIPRIQAPRSYNPWNN